MTRSLASCSSPPRPRDRRCRGAQGTRAPLPQADDAYFVAAQEMLDEHLARQPNTNRAKNVILFVGDGMGVAR